MKKILALVLAALMLFTLAACGGNNATDGNATDGNATDGNTEAVVFEGTLTELCTKLYEANSLEIAVMTEGMAIDLADADSFEYYLGVRNTEDFSEALFSESMIGSQAYSLVLARVNDEAKVEDIKKAIFENINLRKWICVEANQLRVVSSGNIIMMVMLDSAFGETVADGMVDAFAANAGALTGETLTKG